MARRRRKTTRRRKAAPRVAANPRRYRRRARRRNPTIVARRRRSVAANPKRRRYSRRRNPSAAGIGSIFKDMVYGAGGAIATRVVASIAGGFVPAAFASSPLSGPVVQAGVAVTAVRWLGTKFLGKKQGDMMMTGGLISAGLALADAYLPNVQSSLTSIIRAPITVAQTVPQQLAAAGANPDQIAAAGAQLAGMGRFNDVEELPLDSTAFDGLGALGGFGDVEEVPISGIWSGA